MKEMYGVNEGEHHHEDHEKEPGREIPERIKPAGKRQDIEAEKAPSDQAHQKPASLPSEKNREKDGDCIEQGKSCHLDQGGGNRAEGFRPKHEKRGGA